MREASLCASRRGSIKSTNRETTVLLTDEQKRHKIEEYIASKNARSEPWDTLEFDYLRKDLDADIWDADGNELLSDE
jgi:hypothetical protein